MNFLRSLFEVAHGGHRQILSMEGLRGFAVFLVFIVHYTTLVAPWLAPATPTFEWAARLRGIGNAGVDLFFVLSGYLIYGTLIAKPRSMASYFRRRLERIYPAFLAVFVVYLILSLLLPQESKIPTGSLWAAAGYVVANLLLLPGLFPIEPMITVAWSLSYEMFYYLVTPLVIVFLGLRRWPSSARMLAFLGTAVIAIVYVFAFGGSHIRLIMFVSGILLLEALEYQTLPRFDRLGLVALVVGLVAIDQVALGPSRYLVLFVCFFALCYASFRGDGLVHRLFCWTPLRWLGNMSYSYYLIHGLALKAAFLILGKLVSPSAAWTAPGFWMLLPAMFAVTLVPATVLFALVEKPFSLKRATPRGNLEPMNAN
jgi:exopolysaccharide production protein ExoZ